MIFLLIASLGLMAVGLEAAPQPAWRGDWQVIASNLCGQNPTLGDLWRSRLFDAQVEGAQISSSSPIGRQELLEAAKNFAVTNFHNGYFAYQCSHRRAVVLSFPAPFALPLTNHKIDLQGKSDLSTHCQSFQWRWSERNRGRSINLSKKALHIHNERSGYLALICVPKAPAWLGNQEWFLVPTGPAGGDDKPMERFNSGQTPDATRLQSWINQKRKEHGLGPLVTDSILLDAVRSLGQSKAIRHNKAALATAAKRHSSRRFIGENRVKAKDMTEITKLLWISPTHRDLMLAADAAYLGIHLEKVAMQWLVVILIGK